ncbi:MAG: hypothetical protein ACPL7E_01325 [bacterium]
MFKFSPINLEIEKRQFIHPAVAVLLALFDGKRSVKEITNILREISTLTEDDARRDILALLNGDITNGERWLVEAEQSERPLFEKKYNPLEFR